MDKVSLKEKEWCDKRGKDCPLGLQRSTASRKTSVCTTAVSQARGCCSSAAPPTSGAQSATMAGIALMLKLLVGSWDSMTPVSAVQKITDLYGD